MPLPPDVRTITDCYRDLLDAARPGLLEGLYLHGSLGFGEFHPGSSDVDFVAVLAARPGPAEVDAIREALVEVAGRFPRPHFDGFHVVRADLAADPAGCPGVPCVQAGRFEASGRFDVNPVTWHELAWHSVVAHGPRLNADAVWTDRAALHAYSHTNLEQYWRPRLEQVVEKQAEIISGITSGLVDAWIVPWFVLGVPRLHHLLATGRLTSKDGAGRHAIATFGPRWRPIVEEALRLRSGRGGGDAQCTSECLEDMIAFSTMVIEAGVALEAPPVDNKANLWTTSN